MKSLRLFLSALLIWMPVYSQKPATFSLTTNVVVVNVTVLDRNGRPIENLTRDDFQLFEDGKPQRLQSVDLQRLAGQTLPTLTPQLQQRPAPAAPQGYRPGADRPGQSAADKFQDRRLIVLLFDFSSMQAAEQIRAKNAATQFLRAQMTASDEVSIMTYGTTLKTVQDFTADRDLLLSTIDKFRIGESSENAASADTGPDSQDQSGTFTADETEFNIFNADLKLAALEDAARTLGQFPEKKALVYISSGIQKNGVDNQSQLRATVNTAVRANVAFYPIDARGLSAIVPGGDATAQGAAGTGLFSGSGQRSVKENFNNQQETLATLALDTGGKALLDSNDLTEGIRQVQKDFGSYYVLSYVSANTAQDGRYRRIQVKLAPRDTELRAKLDYRQGYYAPTTFNRMQDSDKEAQLSQALLSDNPVTDLQLAVEVDYFRMEKSKYFVPISAKIPGSALQFRSKGSKAATEMDFIADVFDARDHTAATVRDTIPIRVSSSVAGDVSSKSLQYDTGVTLTPGKYRLRFVARENGEGKIGTFETRFTVPDLDASKKALHVSSLILSSGREPVGSQIAGVKNDKKLLQANPLIDNGRKLVPNVTGAFRPGQTALAYLEVYDPTTSGGTTPNINAALSLFRDDKKVYESQPVSTGVLSSGRPNVFPVNVRVPLAQLSPGTYQCQLTVIDSAGHKFAFARKTVALLGSQKNTETSKTAATN